MGVCSAGQGKRALESASSDPEPQTTTPDLTNLGAPRAPPAKAV